MPSQQSKTTCDCCSGAQIAQSTDDRDSVNCHPGKPGCSCGCGCIRVDALKRPSSCPITAICSWLIFTISHEESAGQGQQMRDCACGIGLNAEAWKSMMTGSVVGIGKFGQGIIEAACSYGHCKISGCSSFEISQIQNVMLLF